LFFFSSRRRHTRLQGDWSSDVCSSDLSFSLSVSRTWVGFTRRKRGWLASSSVGGALGAASGASAAGALGAGARGLTSGGLLSAFGGGCDPGRLSTGGPSSSSRGLGSAL